MAADKYFHHIIENRTVYRNLEKAIAHDVLLVRRQILHTLGCGFSDLSCEIFYNVQALVQDIYDALDIDPSSLPILNMDSDKEIAGAMTGDTKPDKINDLICKANREAAQRKEERKLEKIRLKTGRKGKARKRKEERLEWARSLRGDQKRKSKSKRSESK